MHSCIFFFFLLLMFTLILSSLVQWVLGNYLQSFLIVLGLQGDITASESENSFKHAAFLDPSIGQFCEMLATKNSLRNAAGERNTAILCGWATVMIASAFNKCGLPVSLASSVL